MATFEADGNNDKQQQQQAGKNNNPYLAVKQKLRPAGSEKLQQQHKHQYEAIIAAASSVNNTNEKLSIGGYSFSRRNHGNSNSSSRGKKALWKSMLNALYSLVYNVLFHVMFLVIAFAIGFQLPTVKLLQDFGNNKEEMSLLVAYYASSAIVLSLVFTSCQKMSKKMSGNNSNGAGTYRLLDPSDPTAEYINVRERLRKSSMTLKQQQQQQENSKNRSFSGSNGARTKEKTSTTMQCFLFLYSCLSLMSLVATCSAVGFYCHDHHDDYYSMVWTVTMACALTLWFQQRLTLIWQTAFGIGYYLYFNDNHHHHEIIMLLTLGCSILLLTVVAEVLCGEFRHQEDNNKSSKSIVQPRRATINNCSIWTRFTTRLTCASRSRTAATAATSSSPSAADYDDNPNDPYSQVRQRLRKSPTNHASPTTAMQSETAAAIAPAYTDVRQKLHHVDVPDMTDETESNASPVVKSHAAPAKAKEASRDLGLEKTMELLLQQKSRLDTTTTTLLTEAESNASPVVKAQSAPAKAKEASKDLKLEETMRICLEQKSQLKKLEEDNQESTTNISGDGEIIKTSPVAPKGMEGSRDLKLEETMRICLEQKSRLKKRGEPK